LTGDKTNELARNVTIRRNVNRSSLTHDVKINYMQIEVKDNPPIGTPPPENVAMTLTFEPMTLKT